MMMEVEDILKLSSNRNTVQLGQKISKERYWLNASAKDAYIWATFKGKSIQSYSCFVDLSAPIKFKCNCSSRQNPCKHGLGLLLYYNSNVDSFKGQKSYPKELVKWIKKRISDKLNPVSDEKFEELKKEKAAVAKNQNRLKRIGLMKAGAAHVQDWVRDILKTGIAQLEGQEDDFWNAILARAVDHKLGGLSYHLLDLKNTIEEKKNWIDLLPLKLAWLNQVLDGLQNLDYLKEIWQTELLKIGGVTTRSNELEQIPELEDDWVVLNSEEGESEQGGFFRKTWFLGKKSKRMGYQMDYNFREQNFPSLPTLGRWFHGSVVFYPGPTPLRLKVNSFGTPLLNVKKLPAVPDFKRLNNYYIANLKINPWLLDLPVIIEGLLPLVDQAQAILVDNNKTCFPLLNFPAEWWRVMAISAGKPITLFGIWNGYVLSLKGVLAEEVYYSLSE